MFPTDTKTATYGVPTAGWNHNSLEDLFKAQGKEWTPENAKAVATANGITGYTGSGPQNSALLAKLKGYTGTTDPKSISGGAKVGQNMSTNKAMQSGLNSVVPPNGSNGKNTDGPTTPPPPVNTPVTDPNITTLQDQTKTQLADVDKVTQSQLEPLNTQFTHQYGALQDDKTKAMSGAAANYDATHPHSSNELRQAFLDSVSKSYDTQLQNMSDTYNSQVLQINTGAQVQKDQIQQQYTQNVASYKGTLATAFKESIAGFKMGDGKESVETVMDAIQNGVASGKTFEQAKAEVMDAVGYAKRTVAHQQFMENATLATQNRLADAQILALQKEGRMESAQAAVSAKGIYTDFLKANTATQSLAVASRYMPDIEAAKDGKGVNALIMLDGLVKIANGGQAIRQTQFDTAVQSGTYGDAIKKLWNKGGLSYDENTGDISGANVTISANQASQIYNTAKNLVGEQIKTAMPDYQSALDGLDELKANFPGNDKTIEAIAPMKSIGNLINEYNGVTSSSGSSSLVDSSQIPTGYYQASDGLFYPTQ